MFYWNQSQVDLVAAREKGVAVFNAPLFNPARWLVLAEAILCCAAYLKSAVAHRGGWLKSAGQPFEICGKTLGSSVCPPARTVGLAEALGHAGVL
jgi:D-3-phosphoglycerate dehydrogenase